MAKTQVCPYRSYRELCTNENCSNVNSVCIYDKEECKEKQSKEQGKK